MKVAVLFAIVAVCATVVVAIDSDDYLPEETISNAAVDNLAPIELAQVAAEAKAETGAKAQLSASVMMRLDNEAKVLVSSMAFKYPELVRFLKVKSFAALTQKAGGKDPVPTSGYGEMVEIMRAVDKLETKLRDEQAKDRLYIETTRTDCDNVRTRIIAEISRAAANIRANNDNITRKRDLIRDRNKKVDATRVQEASLTSTLGQVKASYSEDENGYWTRRLKRSKERVTLTKALRLICTFREFKDTAYCVRISSQPDEDVQEGCQLKFDQVCTAQEKTIGINVTNMVDTDTNLPFKVEFECMKRAKYWHTACAFPSNVNVTATFLKTSVSFKYPTESYDGWVEKRDKEKQDEDESLRISTLQKTEVKAAIKKVTDTETAAKEQSLKDQEKKAEDSAKGYLNYIARMKTENTLLLASLDSTAQEGAEAKARLGLNALASESSSAPVIALVRSVVVLAESQMLETQASLLDLVVDLRNRMKSEQAKEDADWEAVKAEYQGQMNSIIRQIAEQVTLRNTFLADIVSYNQSINESTTICTNEQNVIAQQKILFDQKTAQCQNEENAYVERLTTTTIELRNVEKLRSLLREISGSTLPKCPGDCIDAAHGRCVWAGRFGKDSYCSCNNEFYGTSCEKRKCPGAGGSIYEKTVAAVCNGRGVCDDNVGVCNCGSTTVNVWGLSTGNVTLAYYHGGSKSCENQRCPGNSNYDPLTDANQRYACNRRGTCNIANGTCSCNARTYGTDCSFNMCPGAGSGVWYPHNHPSVCSGRGSCNYNNGTCSCDPRFKGPSCAEYACPNDCSGRGTCNTANGLCSCNAPYTGGDCSQVLCPSDCHGYSYGYCNYNNGVCNCGRGTNATNQMDCRLPTWRHFHRATWVWGTLDRAGWSECTGGTGMLGLLYNSCSWLFCIEEFLCAQPVLYSNTHYSAVRGLTLVYPYQSYCSYHNFDWYYWGWWWQGSAWRHCGGHTYMVALGRSGPSNWEYWDHYMHNLVSFKCCSMRSDRRDLYWYSCGWKYWAGLAQSAGWMRWLTVDGAPNPWNYNSWLYATGDMMGEYAMIGLSRIYHFHDIRDIYYTLQCSFY